MTKSLPDRTTKLVLPTEVAPVGQAVLARPVTKQFEVCVSKPSRPEIEQIDPHSLLLLGQRLRRYRVEGIEFLPYVVTEPLPKFGVRSLGPGDQTTDLGRPVCWFVREDQLDSFAEMRPHDIRVAFVGQTK